MLDLAEKRSTQMMNTAQTSTASLSSRLQRSPDGDATGLWKTAMLMPHDDAPLAQERATDGVKQGPTSVLMQLGDSDPKISGVSGLSEAIAKHQHHQAAALLLTPHQDDLEFNQFRTDDELLKHGLHRDANYLHGLHRDANYLMPHDDVDRMKRPSRQRSSPRRDAGDDSNLQRSTLQASTSWR
eukprot:s2518_g10.t2